VLHQNPRTEESQSDEYETPHKLFSDICKKYEIIPMLDVCANVDNKKCSDFFNVVSDGLTCSWTVDVWCNPPHSITGKFVKKAYEEWRENNINIVMIIPANTCSSIFWHEYIEESAEYHPIKGRIRFLRGGKPSKHMSRNAYMCIIFRKTNNTLQS
jgi:phage N-6-adenine-methyltransferase